MQRKRTPDKVWSGLNRIIALCSHALTDVEARPGWTLRRNIVYTLLPNKVYSILFRASTFAKLSWNNVRGSGCNALSHLGLANVDTCYPVIGEMQLSSKYEFNDAKLLYDVFVMFILAYLSSLAQ